MRESVISIIKLIKEMGGSDVTFHEGENRNDELLFRFKDKLVSISGIHFNDSTAGLEFCV